MSSSIGIKGSQTVKRKRKEIKHNPISGNDTSQSETSYTDYRLAKTKDNPSAREFTRNVKEALLNLSAKVFGPPKDAWKIFNEKRAETEQISRHLTQPTLPLNRPNIRKYETTVTLAPGVRYKVHKTDFKADKKWGSTCILDRNDQIVTDKEILFKTIFVLHARPHIHYWSTSDKISQLKCTAKNLRKIRTMHFLGTSFDALQGACSKILAANFTGGLSAKAELKRLLPKAALKSFSTMVVLEEFSRWADMLDHAADKFSGTAVNKMTYKDVSKLYYILSNLPDDIEALKKLSDDTFPIQKDESVLWHTIKRVACDFAGGYLKNRETHYTKKAMDRRYKWENAVKFAQKSALSATGKYALTANEIFSILGDSNGIFEYFNSLNTRSEYVSVAFVWAETNFLNNLFALKSSDDSCAQTEDFLKLPPETLSLIRKENFHDDHNISREGCYTPTKACERFDLNNDGKCEYFIRFKCNRGKYGFLGWIISGEKPYRILLRSYPYFVELHSVYHYITSGYSDLEACKEFGGVGLREIYILKYDHNLKLYDASILWNK